MDRIESLAKPKLAKDAAAKPTTTDETPLKPQNFNWTENSDKLAAPVERRKRKKFKDTTSSDNITGMVLELDDKIFINIFDTHDPLEKLKKDQRERVLQKIQGYGKKPVEPKNKTPKYKKAEVLPETVGTSTLRKRQANGPSMPPFTNEKIAEPKTDKSEAPKPNPFSVVKKALRKLDRDLEKSLERLARPKKRK